MRNRVVIGIRRFEIRDDHSSWIMTRCAARRRLSDRGARRLGEPGRPATVTAMDLDFGARHVKALLLELEQTHRAGLIWGAVEEDLLELTRRSWDRHSARYLLGVPDDGDAGRWARHD